MMEGQRHNAPGGRRRRRNKGRNTQRAAAEPLLIVARRPNSPLLAKPKSRAIAASAAPKPQKNGSAEDAAEQPKRRREAVVKDRSAARIVQRTVGEFDAREAERERLLERILLSEGRSAVSRAVDVYVEAGFELPIEQEVQLQLLEHVREDRAREAIANMTALLEHAMPIKKPVLVQRLRRLEEYADEDTTRDAAAELRRSIR
ncbi:MAG: hypothetical protein R3B07_25585 [Polyangiaceae bacterium]